MTSVFTVFLLNIITILVHGDANEFISGNYLFTTSIYREILKGNQENFLVSPFSAETVLTLAHLGARGETAEELRSSLKLPNNRERVITAVKSVLPSLKNNQNYSLHIANKIYLQRNCPLKANFEEMAVEVFNSGIENVDFGKSVEAANKINQWVKEQTANNIHDLVDSDAINSDTRAVLVNALYFQANWRRQFESHNTKGREFYQIGREPVRAIMMHDFQGYYNFYENSELGAKFLEIPFVDETVTMTLALPNEKEGLPSLESRIEEVLKPQNYVSEVVTVAIPTFKIESKLDFKEILMNLGVRKAFDYRVADFGGISDEKLAIDEVIQKTFINVGEKGVEAAAATYAEFVTRTGPRPVDPRLKNFIADHPFLFYIKVKDLIIFAGRVMTLTPSVD